MSAANELLADAFTRVRDGVSSVLDDLEADDLTHRPAPDANPIGWLLWHLLRVQDDHVADAAGTEQIWTSGGWADRFALPFDDSATGYGHSSDDVAAIRVSPDLLAGYADAVHDASITFVKGLADTDLERVVDDSWDPPVTLLVRLVSVIGDDLKHLGQAEYIKGIVTSE
jgi:hypothetical protein